MRYLIIACALALLAGCGKSKAEAPGKKAVQQPDVDLACQGYWGTTSKSLRWVECEVVSLKGPAAKACWRLVLQCKNGTSIKHQTCTAVGKGQTRKIKLGAASLTGGKICAGDNGIAVKVLSVTAL